MKAEENREALDREIKDLSSHVMDETEYLYSSKVNKEHLDKAVKQMGVFLSDITPKSLLELGFKEVYQEPNMGDAGFIFYTLNVHGIEFLSIETDSKDFKIILGESFEIRSLEKLRSLVISLREL